LLATSGPYNNNNITTSPTSGAVASLLGSTEETLTARQSCKISKKETKILADLCEQETAAVAALGKIDQDNPLAFERARKSVYDHFTVSMVRP
jgi:hypothetical protein